MARGCQTGIEPPGAHGELAGKRGRMWWSGGRTSVRCSHRNRAGAASRRSIPAWLAEDRRGRNRTKVAAVARRQLAWIHEKDLILGDHSAAVPTKECLPPAVALARRAHRDCIDVTSRSSRKRTGRAGARIRLRSAVPRERSRLARKAASGSGVRQRRAPRQQECRSAARDRAR